MMLDGAGAWRCLRLPGCFAGVNAASVAEAALMMMLARQAREQEASFQRGDIGVPFGIQLAGKRLGIVGMGNTGR